jgi:thymidylate synthase (FAD)
VTEEPVFYIPHWRTAPENKKQGSGDFANENLSWVMNEGFRKTIKQGLEKYESAISLGIAPEQARVFLPAYAMYVRWWWTGSLAGVIHLIEQRTAPDAQWEFQEYAKVVEKIARERFPASVTAALGR